MVFRKVNLRQSASSGNWVVSQVRFDGSDDLRLSWNLDDARVIARPPVRNFGCEAKGPSLHAVRCGLDEQV